MGQITDPPSSELERARGKIREYKERVEKYETEANEQEKKLNQGLFLILLYMHNEYNIKLNA